MTANALQHILGAKRVRLEYFMATLNNLIVSKWTRVKADFHDSRSSALTLGRVSVLA